MNRKSVKLACGWFVLLTEPGVELAAVMTPPVILNVVVPGLDKWPAPAAVTVLIEPSDNFTCAPWELPTTCQSAELPTYNNNNNRSPQAAC